MKIEKSKYEGYLWYSNKKEPRLLSKDKEFELEIPDDSNPFIIEGQLYEEGKSHSIKYVDGKYIVNDYDLSQLSDIEFTEQDYLFNKMENRKLKFKQYWRPKTDKFCKNMPVLQPAEFVFVGFSKEEEGK